MTKPITDATFALTKEFTILCHVVMITAMTTALGISCQSAYKRRFTSDGLMDTFILQEFFGPSLLLHVFFFKNSNQFLRCDHQLRIGTISFPYAYISREVHG